MLHICTCVEMSEEQYTDKIFRIFVDRYMFHYPRLRKSIRTIFGIYVDRDTFHYPGKIFKIYADRDTFHYLENFHTYFSACVIKINISTAFVIIIKAHKGNVVTGHGFF